jgi:hypothetical protein
VGVTGAGVVLGRGVLFSMVGVWPGVYQTLLIGVSVAANSLCGAGIMGAGGFTGVFVSVVDWLGVVEGVAGVGVALLLARRLLPLRCYYLNFINL